MSSELNLIISIGIPLVLCSILAFVFWRERKRYALHAPPPTPVREAVKHSSNALQLQAYERLILLADRIALPQLIHRVNQQGLTVNEMQALLVQTIRQEYEHNITQQIYVSKESWEAITNFKEQNILIINKIGNLMPPDATGIDFNRQLLELIAQNPNVSLHGIVSEALSFEAKKLL